MNIVSYCSKAFKTPEYTRYQPVWVRVTSYEDPYRGTFLKYNRKTVQVRVFPKNDSPFVRNVHPSFVSPRLIVADYWTSSAQQKEAIRQQAYTGQILASLREGVHA